MVKTVYESDNTNSVKGKRLDWIDQMKAIAIIWIILNHVIERLFGSPYIANPSANWPPLAERIAQLQPLEGHGFWDIFLNSLRYLGWAGDQGVQLFLILSGFSLTWSLLNRKDKGSIALGEFYRRRLGRIYPMWWGVHLVFIASWMLIGWGLPLTDKAVYLSLIGFRITPSLFYYFAPAWWFIGLLIQLYLIYPVLWKGLQRRGPLWLLGVSCGVAFAVRAVGLLWLDGYFDGYLDAWQRGAIFITRLPEFVFGISVAAWLYRSPNSTDERLRKPSTLLLAVAFYSFGTVLALTLLGMAIAPFLLGVGAFVLLYAALTIRDRSTTRGVGLWQWVGRHSYSLFLIHHPLIVRLIPTELAGNNFRVLVGIAAALLLTVVGAIALEWAVGVGSALVGSWYKHLGITRAALSVVGFAAIGLGLLISSELIVRQVAPQEVLGWGERPSLQPHPLFGWNLKPSQETRLRWESYDYRVKANALGFPEPQYSEQKTPQTLRILTTGDAFTSAEGVDTNQAWPRLLEAKLKAQLPSRKVEVLNFAITGYGPNQYAAVVEKFAPQYKPDLIIIESFVNDYQDVLLTDDDFRQSIGFQRPDPNNWRFILSLVHLRRLINMQLHEPLRALLRGNPSPPLGYFFGNFTALERNRPNLEIDGRQRLTDRFKEIQAMANQVGAKVIVAMVPASVQVCKPSQLPYYPHNVNLADSTKFDLELPQRMTKEIANSLGFNYYDLRPSLKATQNCPYQPHNMHWTVAGHRAVAAYLAQTLKVDGYINEPTKGDIK